MPFAGIKLEGLPNVEAWVKRITERPAVKKGMAVPSEEGSIYKGTYIKDDPDSMRRMKDGAAKIASARAALK